MGKWTWRTIRGFGQRSALSGINQPGLLGHGYKLIGHDDSPCGMHPSNQGFESHRQAVLACDLGLIDHEKLMAVERFRNASFVISKGPPGADLPSCAAGCWGSLPCPTSKRKASLEKGLGGCPQYPVRAARPSLRGIERSGSMPLETMILARHLRSASNRRISTPSNSGMTRSMVMISGHLSSIIRKKLPGCVTNSASKPRLSAIH